MKKAILFSLLVVFCILGADTFSIQGVLRDPLGRTVEDGNYNLVFRIYEVDAGGSSIWEESQGSVIVSNGVFGVELGIVSSLDEVPFDENYWIGITVNEGVEMDPRFKLTKSPSAMSVYGYENVFPSVGNVGLGTHDPEAKLHIIVSDTSADKLRVEDENGDNDVVVKANGQMGLNVELPLADLHINSTSSGADKLLIENSDGSTNVIVKSDGQVGINEGTPEADLHIVATASDEDRLLIENIDGTNQLIVTSDGKIGVNVNEPAQALDINGNLKMRTGGIIFDDGSTLLSADMGGSASSLSNFGNAWVTADSDEDGTGNLDLVSGATTCLRITPTEKLMIDTENASVDTNGTFWIGSIITGRVSASSLKAPYWEDATDTTFRVDPNDDSFFHALSIGHTMHPTGQLDIRGTEEVRIWSGYGNAYYATGQGDLYVEDDLEVDGHIFCGKYHDKNDTNYFASPAEISKFHSLSIGHIDDPTGALDIRGDEVRIWDGTASVDYATDEGDLYVENDLEVDGNIYCNGDNMNANGLYLRQSNSAALGYWYIWTGPGENLRFDFYGFPRAYISQADGAYFVNSREDSLRGVEPEDGGLDKVLQLQPKRFHFYEQDDRSPKCLGFLASEVQAIYPELVGEDDGKLSLNYAGFSVAAISAIQELNEKVEDQGKTIESLIKRLEALEIGR